MSAKNFPKRLRERSEYRDHFDALSGDQIRQETLDRTLEQIHQDLNKNKKSSTVSGASVVRRIAMLFVGKKLLFATSIALAASAVSLPAIIPWIEQMANKQVHNNNKKSEPVHNAHKPAKEAENKTLDILSTDELKGEQLKGEELKLKEPKRPTESKNHYKPKINPDSPSAIQDQLRHLRRARSFVQEKKFTLAITETKYLRTNYGTRTDLIPEILMIEVDVYLGLKNDRDLEKVLSIAVKEKALYHQRAGLYRRWSELAERKKDVSSAKRYLRFALGFSESKEEAEEIRQKLQALENLK